MANKLPWFTHDHNARNDEFIQRAEDRFGHFGYAAYFKLLEVIHEHGTGGVLRMTKSRLALNLRSRWPQVEAFLLFAKDCGKFGYRVRRKSGGSSTSGGLQPDFGRTPAELQFDSSQDEVELQNKKFITRLHKSKSNPPAIPPESPSNPVLHREGERQRERQKVGGAARPTFTPPTLDQVKAYCAERAKAGAPGVDAYKFHDFYSAKGWMVGRNRMKDWQAAVRTWERSDDAKPAQVPAGPTKPKCQRCRRDFNWAVSKASDGKTEVCQSCLDEEKMLAEDEVFTFQP